jgi:hypothetical protein
MIKKILIAIVLLIVAGVVTGYYMWHMPHQKVEDARGISITADALLKEYTANEKAADARYLNKAIEVAGTVSEIEKNQDGGLMVILQTADATAGIQCAMRDAGTVVTKGQKVTIKGFCSGSGIMGISLTDCVLIK